MITKVRKFGEERFVEVEHSPDACEFCSAARLVRWCSAGDVIFFENEAGIVHRVESLCVGGSYSTNIIETAGTKNIVAIDCQEVPADWARAEIAERAPQ